MSRQTVHIPENFILGAAASAWQTEGWSGKKRGRTPGLTPGISRIVTSGTTATARRLPPTLSTALVRMWR